MATYQRIGPVGSGAFATVYAARHIQSGEVVAEKEFKNFHKSRVNREISLLKQLSKRTYSFCIARYLDRISRGTHVSIVMEYYDYNLLKYIRWKRHIHRYQIKLLMYQLCRALAFIHETGVLHRDLKPDNILMDLESRKIKISDFGEGRRYTLDNQRYTPQRGHMNYRAPEILDGATRYSTEVDVWSLGCIFAELVNGQPLFSETSLPRQRALIASTLHGSNLDNVVPRLRGSRGMDLMKRMLCYGERISALEAKDHPYFDEVRGCFLRR